MQNCIIIIIAYQIILVKPLLLLSNSFISAELAA